MSGSPFKQWIPWWKAYLKYSKTVLLEVPAYQASLQFIPFQLRIADKAVSSGWAILNCNKLKLINLGIWQKDKSKIQSFTITGRLRDKAVMMGSRLRSPWYNYYITPPISCWLVNCSTFCFTVTAACLLKLQETRISWFVPPLL